MERFFYMYDIDWWTDDPEERQVGVDGKYILICRSGILTATDMKDALDEIDRYYGADNCERIALKILDLDNVCEFTSQNVQVLTDVLEQGIEIMRC